MGFSPALAVGLGAATGLPVGGLLGGLFGGGKSGGGGGVSVKNDLRQTNNQTTSLNVNTTVGGQADTLKKNRARTSYKELLDRLKRSRGYDAVTGLKNPISSRSAALYGYRGPTSGRRLQGWI